MIKQFFKPTSLVIAINIALFTSTAAYAEEMTAIVINTEENLPETTLAPITVVASIEQADGPVKGIAASTVSSTTGTDESILKSTQSISVIGKQEIDSIGALDVSDALEYSAGVSAVNTEDKTMTDTIIRGFTNVSEYRDGHKYQASYFNGQQELYGLERLEVVKGPGSVLSSTLPPGGVVNAISKKPFFDNAYEVNAELGSFERKQVATDLNHVINDDMAVRLVGVYRDSDTFVDFVPDERTYIAPSITWQPTNATRLNIQAHYQNDLTKYVPGMPASGTILPNPNGQIATERYAGVPSFDKYENTSKSIGYDIEHRLNPDLKLKHYLRQTRFKADFPWTSTSFDWIDASKSQITRKPIDRRTESKQTTTGISAQYNWTWQDNIENVLLAGIDHAQQQHDARDSNGTAAALDLFNPVYDSQLDRNTFVPSYFSFELEDTQDSVYLQNQATINERWVAILGARHNRVDMHQASLAAPIQKQERFSASIGRVGLAYLMDNGLAPYASVNQSFEVNRGFDFTGGTFGPTKGIQYEVGMRYQPEGSDTLLTGSVYRIDQTDPLQANPDVPGSNIQLGKIRSEGVELEAKTQLGDHADLIAAYAYTDARILEGSPLAPSLDDKRLGNVPYHKFSLWGNYNFADYNLPQLKVGAGIRYSGEATDSKNIYDILDHTLVDAMMSYEVNDHWLLSLNARNLLNEEYVTCTYACFYGEPRNVVGKVTYTW